MQLQEPWLTILPSAPGPGRRAVWPPGYATTPVNLSYVTVPSFRCSQCNLSCFVLQQFEVVCPGVGHFDFYPAWSPLSSWDVFFHQIWEVLGCYFLKYPFFPFSFSSPCGTPVVRGGFGYCTLQLQNFWFFFIIFASLLISFSSLRRSILSSVDELKIAGLVSSFSYSNIWPS